MANSVWWVGGVVSVRDLVDDPNGGRIDGEGGGVVRVG